MIGDNTIYDPDLENTEVKTNVKRSGVDDKLSSVSALIAMGGRSSFAKLPKSKNQLSFATLSNNSHLLLENDSSGLKNAAR